MNGFLRRAFASALVALWASALAATADATAAPATKPGAGANPAVVAFLIGASATDFALPASPHPVGIRAARIGLLPKEASEGIAVLCGEFRVANPDGATAWTPFATLKTSDYEQWLGGNAASFCRQKAIKWSAGDHSKALLDRIRELQPTAK